VKGKIDAQKGELTCPVSW